MCLDLGMYEMERVYIQEFSNEMANSGDLFANIIAYEQYGVLDGLNHTINLNKTALAELETEGKIVYI